MKDNGDDGTAHQEDVVLGENTESEAGGTEGPPLTGLSLDDGRPTFEAPWQARAFAVAVILSDHYESVYSWSDFQERLVEEIQSDEAEAAEGARDAAPSVNVAGSEQRYYEQWLRALERVAIEEGLLDADEVHRRVSEFSAGERDASEFVEGEHDHDHGEGGHGHGHHHANGHDSGHHED